MSHTDAPDGSVAAASTRSTRNPRRRARPDSDSIKVAPRRKRSKITETTFLPREETPLESDEQMNGHSTRKVSGLSANGIDMPVRSRAKRVSRVDSTILAQNQNYSVKLLRNTPKELKDTPYRGSINAQSNLALAVTKEKAYVWDHAGSSTSVRTVDIPSDISSHTLPFGALVAGPGNELGLLLISSHSSKVIYHETLSRPSAVTANIGFFSGEHVTQLVSAHPAGYIAVLSSGRLVHLTLHDSQGRPKIQSQLLHANEQTTGLFGSLKSILASTSWKQTVSAVHTRPLERGQVQALALLERGELRAWNLDWSGHSEYQNAIDVRENVSQELRQMLPPEQKHHAEQLAFLDFAFLDSASAGRTSQELTRFSSQRPIDATLLVQCGPSRVQTLFLVQISLKDEKIELGRILKVDSDSGDDHARLLIPAPFNTAFITRSSSVTVLSLLIAASDPEAQLHEASYIEPEPFQDTIFLREHILSAEGDVSKTDSSSLLFVQGAVLKLTVSATPEQLQPWEVVKSRFEQAIFYGTQEGNVLDLLKYSFTNTADVERAALRLSEEIFTSSSSFLDTPPISIESSLIRRAGALHTLAEILRKSNVEMSKPAVWQLLIQAEKTAAAIKLWSLYEHSAIESKSKRVANLWHEIMQCVDEKEQFNSIYETSSIDDLIRTFFVTQLERLTDVLTFACRVMIMVASKENETTPETAIRITSEADNIWLGCLETVYDFRINNAALYGISPTKLEEGIAAQPSDLQDVDELWTSSSGLLNQIGKMTEEARQIAADSYEADPSPVVEQFVQKVAEENPRLIEVCCLMFRERITWCLSRSSPKYTDQAEKLQQAYESTRHAQLRTLAQVGQAAAGIKLAEKYHDMDTLTEMIIAESQYLSESRIGAPPTEREAIDIELEKNNKRVSKYFELYGDEFSDAFFGHSIASGRTGLMLTHGRWTAPLTTYLRKDVSRGKLCWINDVLQDDYQHAGDVLQHVAMQQEQNVWSKSVQLSLAKLSMAAAHESRGDQALTQAIDQELSFTEVQSRLYEHLSPATYHSLDAEAAVKDALTSFAREMRSYPLHYEMLGNLIEKVLDHKTLNFEELIDVLTLTDAYAESREDKDEERSETFEALQALAFAPASNSTDLQLKLIWKRAFLQENWEQLNDVATREGDSAAREFASTTNLYRAIHAVLELEHKNFQILQPEQTLAAGTFIGDLPSYVPEEVAEQYLEENIKMEQELEELIKEQRITSWVADFIRFAKDAIWAASEEQNSSSRQAAEAQMNGHSVNGITNGIKTEEEVFNGFEPDDDVSMA